MGDVNGDGQPDIVVTDSVANTAVVLLNNYVPGSGSVCVRRYRRWGSSKEEVEEEVRSQESE